MSAAAVARTITGRRAAAAWLALLALATLACLAPAATAPAARPAHIARSAGGARCVPSALNRSAILPGTPLAVSPLPGSYDASPATQISFLGAAPHAIVHVAARGSRSGRHPGVMRAYSQGDGASFLPSRSFAPGETVTVTGAVATRSRARRFSFQFVVSLADPLPYFRSSHPNRDPNEKQHFLSRPDLEPPALVVAASSPKAEPGDIFAAPYSGPGPSGPMIFDAAGHLVWFDPMHAGTESANLQVQSYYGHPVLTWWQGYIPPQGFGEGEEVILDSSYRQIGRIHAGNGFKADLHDFHLGERATALLTVYHPLRCDLSSVHGPSSGAVTDTIYQEVDIPTGLVRREWHGLDHIPLSDSYSSARTASLQWPFDYFHLNSFEQLANGTTLISARNTSALYVLRTATGQVLTRIGGRRSNVRLSPGAATAYQHDATLQPDGTITIFDNGADPKVHSQSRGVVVQVDAVHGTDTLLTQLIHPSPLLSGSQGNVQRLPNGDLFVGWGSRGFFSEFSPSGAVLFDAYMHGSYQSYRAYRFPWTGAPVAGPSLVAVPAAGGGPITLAVSWNGDNRTTQWRILEGPTPQQLVPVTTIPRAGFETTTAIAGPAPYVAAQALDGTGAVLGTSATIRG